MNRHRTIPHRTIAGLTLLALASPSAAARDDADVDRALQTAAELLVLAQESYVTDPPVGRLSNRKLPKWQRDERKRLDSLAAEQPEADRGEWPYEGVYRVGVGRIPAGYRVGGTAIVCSALVLTPGFSQMPERLAAVDRGLQFMLSELESNEELEAGPKQGYDVRGWGHTYALDFFLLAKKWGLLGARAERVETMIPDLIRRLAVNETTQGGWNYAGDTISPFMTGSTLLALYEARAQGYAVDAGLVERALVGLEAGRTAIGSFQYAGPAREKVAMPGSSARAAIAELALFKAGRSDEGRLRDAIDGFFDGWSELSKRKSRQGTHEGAYGIAPYYFFYGHTYAALAIEQLPESDRHARRDALRKLLWKTREKDGSWNDRIFPRTRSYATAMASLALLAPRLDPIPGWAPPPESRTPLPEDEN